MTQAIRGLKGYGFFRDGTDTPITQKVGANLRYNSFNLSSSNDETLIQAFNAASSTGALETLTTFINSTEWNLEVGMVGFDWYAFQWLIGEFAKETASYTRPKYKTGTTNGSGVLTDTDLNGLTAAQLNVSIASKGSWGDPRPLKVVTAAPADTTEIQLDNSANTLTNASLASVPLDYWVEVAEANKETIGVEDSPQLIEEVGYFGIISMTGEDADSGVGIRIRKMTKGGDFNFEIGGGEVNNSLIYTPGTASGYRSVVEWIRL